MAASSVDGRVQRGNETRRAVLGRAVEIASLESLNALSIGRLATDLGLSKSGVFAAFGSKEELQLSTIRAARRIFYDSVIAPALAVPPGIGQVWRLCEAWLAYSRARVFPGGCFFYSVGAEFATQPGVLRDALVEAQREWEDFFAELLESARAAGELKADADIGQLVFMLDGYMETANAHSLLFDDFGRYDRAQRAILGRLRAEAVNPDLLPTS